MAEPAKGTGGEMARPAELYALFRPLESLPGVGPKVARLCARLLGRSEPRLLDLLFTPPVRRRDIADRRRLEPEDEGRLVALELVAEEHRPGHGRSPYRIRCTAERQNVTLVFFHARQPWLERRFPPDRTVRVIGRPELFNDQWQIVHPEPASEGGRDATVYRLIEGLGALRLKRLIDDALAEVGELPEWHDPATLEAHDLPPWRAALAVLHGRVPGEVPLDDAAIERARRRLALDELTATQLALALVRRSRDRVPAPPLAGPSPRTEAMLASLPFTPTGAQARAIGEIATDLARPIAMARLLMGDVGSGKTLVALAAMLRATDHGRQAVMMAPTEVLARQHARSLGALAEPLGLEIDLLIGGDSAADRRRALERIASGEAAITVGTHALFQEGVTFNNLALAVIDEQHRFGVAQRLGLVAKGHATHLLLMTATPIPRSLVLSAYGDVETSRLDEKPPGRQPIVTAALPRRRLEEVLERVAAAIGRDERIYWICPSVAEATTDGPADDDTGRIAAETRFGELQGRFGKTVGLVHGKLKTAEKTAAMQAFASGRTRLLVATTVIEVGVDVPEATVIVIDGAQHFGLAQLHQLRGRVGRGSRPSACVLLYDPPLGEAARARLAILRESEDGFRLAEEDLRLRGPGEVLGVRQSGLPELRFADLADDGDLVATAHDGVAVALAQNQALAGERGRALRLLLHLFERYEAVGCLAAG
jgi:ATP-dependent DNA helicase RecG